jgi:membrane protease YdiL (CAAX protease family)
VQRGGLEVELGLVGLVAFTLIALAPLVALRGEAPLLRILAMDPNALSDNRGMGGQVLDLYYSLAWLIPLALLGAGVPVRRSLAGGLQRLGIRRLAWRLLPVLLAIAAALVGLGFALDWAISSIWTAFGWPRTDPELVNRLFADAMTPAGAASAAITAGLGEELIARGLLQPRLGWLLPNLAFAATHAFQYGPDGLVSVFVIGALLALVRARWNTSASALVHGSYDLALFAGSLMDLPGF